MSHNWSNLFNWNFKIVGFEVRQNQELLFLIPPDVKTHNFSATFLHGRNINNMTFMISLKNKVKIVSLVGILRSIVGIALLFTAKNECPPLTSATPPPTSATPPPTTAEGAGASYSEPTFSPEENWVRIPLRIKRAVTSLTRIRNAHWRLKYQIGCQICQN